MAKYTAKQGDTLRKLAKKYGVTRKELRELNPDVKFGKGKKKGGKGFKDLGDQEIRLGPGVGPRGGKLLQDPKYSAFLRNFDYQRDKLQSDFIEFKNRQSRDLARQEPLWARQREDAFRGIDTGAENRGLYRSGQRLLDRGRANSALMQQRQGYIDAQGEAREEARRTKQSGIADLKRRKAEEKLQAGERLTMRDANIEYGYG